MAHVLPDRIRILIVTATSDVGGTERQVALLAAGLDRARFEARVVSLLGEGALTRELEGKGIAAENLDAGGGENARGEGSAGVSPAIAKAGRMPTLPSHARSRARAVVQEFRPQVAYLFGLRSDALLRGPCARAGSIVVSAIRNTDPWRRWWHVALDRMGARHVTKFVSNSEAGKLSRVERERFAAERIAVIRNGVPVPAFEERASLGAAFREHHAIASDALLVGLAGNYRPQKGHLVALDAFTRVSGEFPSMRMVFAGRDYMDGAVRAALREHGLDTKVLALDQQADLAPLYAALDCFILPSDYEGMPNTLMEAMAWGVPCIATRVGGIPEILREEDGGILIPARDPGALAQAIAKLARDPELCARASKGLRARIISDFSVERMVNAHAELFEQLVATKRS